MKDEKYLFRRLNFDYCNNAFTNIFHKNQVSNNVVEEGKRSSRKISRPATYNDSMDSEDESDNEPMVKKTRSVSSKKAGQVCTIYYSFMKPQVI